MFCYRSHINEYAVGLIDKWNQEQTRSGKGNKHVRYFGSLDSLMKYRESRDRSNRCKNIVYVNFSRNHFTLVMVLGNSYFFYNPQQSSRGTSEVRLLKNDGETCIEWNELERIVGVKDSLGIRSRRISLKKQTDTTACGPFCLAVLEEYYLKVCVAEGRLDFESRNMQSINANVYASAMRIKILMEQKRKISEEMQYKSKLYIDDVNDVIDLCNESDSSSVGNDDVEYKV